MGLTVRDLLQFIADEGIPDETPILLQASNGWHGELVIVAADTDDPVAMSMTLIGQTDNV